MPTYYVRPDGNDANTGLGSSAAQAWQTITKAVGATGITSGDTLYVAPGTYRSATGFTIATAYTSATQMLADPTAAQFSGIAAGPVRLSVFTPTDTSAGTSNTVLSGTTNNLLIQGFEIYGFTGNGINITATASTIIEKCVCFGSTANNTIGIQITPSGTNTSGTKFQIRNCIVVGFFGGINIQGPTGGAYLSVFADLYENFCVGQLGGGGIGVSFSFSSASPTYGAITNIYNNVIIGTNGHGIIGSTFSSPGVCNIVNNLVMNCSTGLRGLSSVFTIATNNRVINCTTTSNAVNFGASNGSNGIPGIDVGQGLLHNLTSLQFAGSYLGSPNTSFGTTGLNSTDLFGVAWSGTSPDAGAITYRSLATLTPTYQPTERNASTITIAPGSTSQSIELYLGATGLTASTTGLSAYYVRNRSNPVAISLVSQTATGSWLSGGFAEISSSNVPGFYRLDVPNAAFVSGVDRVTVTVRGASGTNGAVVDCQLISSQLDLTQAVPTSNTANTIGDCLNAARAQGFGKWTVIGTTLRLYAPDGTTVVRTFTLDSETSPSQRV